MIRTEQFKLILRYAFEGKTYPNELYDLKSDPRETINCFNDPTHQQTVKELSEQLDRYFEKYTVEGHSGIQLEGQLPCHGSPAWDPNPPANAKPN